MMSLILELLGTVAFAVSGAMVGIRAKMDLFGVAVLGLTTAVGGGILRDLVIGTVPPTAFRKPVYALTAILVSLIVFLPTVRSRIREDDRHLNLIDAIGLGVFTVVGVRTGIPFDNGFLQVFLGVVTGVGGGVLRDLFAMEKPMIFVHHFYALASIAGAVVCVLLLPVREEVAMAGGTLVVVVLRLLAARYRWNLPRA